MIKSMTAYSRASTSSPLGRLVIEIHSVNRKMLDMSLYLPKEFLRFNMDLRKLLAGSLERGQVTLRLTLQSEGSGSTVFSGYLSQLKTLKEGWEKIAADLDYDPGKTIDLRFLVSQLQMQAGVESIDDEEAVKAVLKAAVEKALEDLMRMKETEGEALVLDILKRLSGIEETLSAVESKKELPLAHYQKKLLERLKEIGQVQQEMEERIAREVALLAEKMDVTEELVRLSAHIGQFRSHLRSSEKSVGRTLDFLTQEMHREINTLGSKSANSEISQYVIKMKSELDKIREQVQNIE